MMNFRGIELTKEEYRQVKRKLNLVEQMMPYVALSAFEKELKQLRRDSNNRYRGL